MVVIDEQRHGTTVPARCLDVPLLPDLVALVEQLGTFGRLADVDFRHQDVLNDDGSHVFQHLLPIKLDLLIHPKLLVSFQFHLLHVLLSLQFGSLFRLSFLLFLY